MKIAALLSQKHHVRAFSTFLFAAALLGVLSGSAHALNVVENSISNPAGAPTTLLAGMGTPNAIAAVPAVVPEPTSWALIFGGLGFLIWRLRSRRMF